jgi:endonuclease G
MRQVGTPAAKKIAVKMPNNNSITGHWKNYRVSVDAVESLTGYDF